MNQAQTGRMLLSHNFNLPDKRLPELSREEFSTIFSDGFHFYPNIRCRLLTNPHWIVELLFPTSEFSPAQLGDMCAQILEQKRLTQKTDDIAMPDILVLGGIKHTPANNNTPDSLQPGEWGVDVVETASAEQFLQTIGWQATIAQKSPDDIFKVELKS